MMHQGSERTWPCSTAMVFATVIFAATATIDASTAAGHRLIGGGEAVAGTLEDDQETTTCQFCPHPKTAKVFGAAASGSAISSIGVLSPNEAYAAVAAEDLEVLDMTVYKCEEWERLPAQLAAAATAGVKLVAGFESESEFAKFCPNFKGADGLVDWPGVAAQLANLSLAYPNLVGYRFDDYIGCCHLQQYGNLTSNPNPTVYYGGLPQDTEKMQAAAKAINPDFMMLAVVYDAQLAFQSPFSFSFGQRAWLQPAIPSQATAGHHGSFLPAGTSVTMRVAFDFPASAAAPAQLRLDFLETTQFLYGVTTADALAKSHGLVRRQLSANGRCLLLDHDLANITDSLFPPSTPQTDGRVFVHSISISPACLNAGRNVLEWELRGTANLSSWYSTHKNFVSVWDIFLEGPMVPRGRALVGNSSWTNVSFDINDFGPVVPATAQGQVRPAFVCILLSLLALCLSLSAEHDYASLLASYNVCRSSFPTRICCSGRSSSAGPIVCTANCLSSTEFSSAGSRWILFGPSQTVNAVHQSSSSTVCCCARPEGHLRVLTPFQDESATLNTSDIFAS